VPVVSRSKCEFNRLEMPKACTLQAQGWTRSRAKSMPALAHGERRGRSVDAKRERSTCREAKCQIWELS
jgi:hypothetical protein